MIYLMLTNLCPFMLFSVSIVWFIIMLWFMPAAGLQGLLFGCDNVVFFVLLRQILLIVHDQKPLPLGSAALTAYRIGQTHHFVGHGDRPRLKLKQALGGDQVRHFLGQIDVGHLQCPLADVRRSFVTI